MTWIWVLVIAAVVLAACFFEMQVKASPNFWPIYRNNWAANNAMFLIMVGIWPVLFVLAHLWRLIALGHW